MIHERQKFFHSGSCVVPGDSLCLGEANRCVVPGGAQTGAVVLAGDCDVVTGLIRSGRWTKSGAARAVGQQLAKDLAAMLKEGQLSNLCPNP